jgi:hypothetical protein
MSDPEPTETAKIIKKFIDNVDISKEHSLEKYLKIMTTAFNSVKVKPVKKQSQYQIFMKDRMKELKQENPDKNAKDIMKMAASEWTNKKNQTKEA